MTTIYFHDGKSTGRREVLEAIREFPGSTSRELHDVLPHIPLATLCGVISRLHSEGVLKYGVGRVITMANGRPKTQRTHEIDPDFLLKSPRRKPSKKPSVLVDNRVRELEVQLAELKAWKEDAIARYPDLKVDPLVLRARQLVAEELRASDEPKMAEDVMAGYKDGSPLMRVTIRVLERSA